MKPNNKVYKSIILLLIFMNIMLIIKTLYLRNIIQTKNINSNNKININNFDWSLVGYKLDVSKISMISKKSLKIKNISGYKLLALFTIFGCKTCLRNELIEWENLYRHNYKIKFFPIIVNNNMNYINWSIKKFSPTIPIYYYKGNIANLLIDQTVRVFLLNEKNEIINYYDGINNEKRRKNFYKNIVNLLK